MKKTILLFSLALISMSAVCQTQKKDTTEKKVVITDTTKIISIKDIETFGKLLSKIPHDEYMSLSPNDALQQFYLWIMERYKAKK